MRYLIIAAVIAAGLATAGCSLWYGEACSHTPQGCKTSG